MTEDEAKTKWCPFTRVISAVSTSQRKAEASAVQPPFNRLDTGPGEFGLSDASACIASACMAWRWRSDDVSGSGFCGLAGPPR